MSVIEMETTQTTDELSRLERLIRLYEMGQSSSLMDRVLDKVFAQEAADTQEALERLHTDIQTYEEQYGMSSELFDSQFHAGELGDRMDFVEWSSLIFMRTHLQKRLEVLTGK